MLAQSTICPCCLNCPLLPSNPRIFSKMLPCCLKRRDDAKSNDYLKDSAKPCHLFAFWLEGVLANLQVGQGGRHRKREPFSGDPSLDLLCIAMLCKCIALICSALFCIALLVDGLGTTQSTKHPEIGYGIDFVDGYLCSWDIVVVWQSCLLATLTQSNLSIIHPV